MTVRRILCIATLLLATSSLWAQSGRNSIEVDYTHPKKYVVGGVGIEGNQYFNEHQILQLVGMQPGQEVTAPGEDITGVVKRLVAQRYFEDVAVVGTSGHSSSFGTQTYQGRLP